MVHFNSIADYNILFHRHYVNHGEPATKTYLLRNDGQLTKIVWNKSSSIDSADSKFSIRLNRGKLYTIYENLAPYAEAGSLIQGADNLPDSYFEVYLFAGNKCVYVDADTGEPKPILITRTPGIYLGGVDVTDYILKGQSEGGELLGDGFLEAFFDYPVKTGFEAIALNQIYEASSYHDDDELFEQGQAFLKWLLHGQGLPEYYEALFEYLREESDVYRDNMDYCFKSMPLETALIRGADFLRNKLNEKEVAYVYLQGFANEKPSPLLCRRLAEISVEEGLAEEAMKYATIGASLGNGACCQIAARMSDANGWADLEKMYLTMGMDAGDPDCFAFMANEIMRYGNAPEDHPFHMEKPYKEALYYADQGVQRRSAKAMVMLARLMEDVANGMGEVAALQLLLRAEALGEKEALYRLGSYYKRDHKVGEGKDLFLAKSYVKRAMIENGYDLAACQLLYADILLEEGEEAQGVEQILELASKGHESAQVFLGKLISGIDPRSRLAKDPIPMELLKKGKAVRAFLKLVLWRNYPEIISPEKAASELEEMAKEGDPLALYELAKIYRDGPEYIRDQKKAAYYTERYENHKDKE